jgi:hypothetical protein
MEVLRHIHEKRIYFDFCWIYMTIVPRDERDEYKMLWPWALFILTCEYKAGSLRQSLVQG